MTHDIEPTIQDVLVAVNQFATSIEAKMVTKDEFYTELNTLKATMVTRDEFYAQLDQLKDVMVTKDEFNFELTNVKGKLAQVVTKDYLDDKLSDLRGEFFLKTKFSKKRSA